MLLNKGTMFECHIWKFENGRYCPATEREIAVPGFEPIITFFKILGFSNMPTPMIYENDRLYFVYIDAITGDQTKEMVELIGRDENKLIKEAKMQLEKLFSGQ